MTICPKGLKISTPVWLDILENQVQPMVVASMHGACDYVLQIDNAPSHGNVAAKDWYAMHMPGRIMMQPPRSPDLNGCDFVLWELLKNVLRTMLRANNVTEFTTTITLAWARMCEEYAAVWPKLGEEFQRRLREVVRMKGGHIEGYATLATADADRIGEDESLEPDLDDEDDVVSEDESWSIE